jgi:LysR family transcriptional activator of nhaA
VTDSGFSYHHLRYFLVVAERGSMTAAAEAVGVTQPTVSAQIAELERDLGARLFRRRGNRLELTEDGRVAQRYAAEIFSLGASLVGALAGARGGAPLRLVVGISDSLPLLTAHRILEPALALPPESVRLVLRVDKSDRLLAGLSARTLDIALTDTPVGPTSPVRASSRLLAESDVSIFGAPSLVAGLSGEAPDSLDGAPFLLHTENTPLRRGLDAWFVRTGIRPWVAAEVEDVALLQILGQTGRGFFAAPSMVEGPIRERYGVGVVCRPTGVVEEIYGVTLDAEPDHPAVRAIFAGAGLRATGRPTASGAS